jgi:hypothetical protein
MILTTNMYASQYTCINELYKLYEACPESKDTQVLTMYNFLNLQKRHEWIAFT